VRKASLGARYPAWTPSRLSLANSVSASVFMSFAISEDSVPWAWVLNNLGQTGTGGKENKINVPTTKVVGLSKEELCSNAVVMARFGFGFVLGGYVECIGHALSIVAD
jgi:hypothetical protein